MWYIGVGSGFANRLRELRHYPRGGCTPPPGQPPPIWKMITAKPRVQCMLVAMLPSSGVARAKTITNKTPMVARSSQTLRRA